MNNGYEAETKTIDNPAKHIAWVSATRIAGKFRFSYEFIGETEDGTQFSGTLGHSGVKLSAVDATGMDGKVKSAARRALNKANEAL